MCIKSKWTIFFDDPYWVGVYERVDNERFEAARTVFGAEPKDYVIYEFFLQNWSKLRFSPPIEVEHVVEKRINPKRVQRQINNQLSQIGIGTKAQQALKLQQEEGKKVRHHSSKLKKEAEEQRKFDLRQEKKKEKQRGR